MVRVVLDTNVLISALLKPRSVPGRALAAIWARGATPLYDDRIEIEYRSVLFRPKFKAIERADIDAFFAELSARGVKLQAVSPYEGALTDGDDRMFIEVALAGAADAIVTGNLRDYPAAIGIPVYPPATLLAMLEEGIAN